MELTGVEDGLFGAHIADSGRFGSFLVQLDVAFHELIHGQLAVVIGVQLVEDLLGFSAYVYNMRNQLRCLQNLTD